MPPEMTKEQRRKAIVKRAAARKISATWQRKRDERDKVSEPSDDFGGLPETDTVLDELPDSLIG